MKISFKILSLIGLCFFSCSERDALPGGKLLTASPDSLTEQEAENINNEIRTRVDQYIGSVMALDSTAMLDFWSDSKDFVYAGDGRVLGGYEKWIAQMLYFVRSTSSVLYWKNENIHVKALAPHAASYTMDFSVGFVNHEGDTTRNEGAWTYVFERTGGKWKVIQTNGTH